MYGIVPVWKKKASNIEGLPDNKKKVPKEKIIYDRLINEFWHNCNANAEQELEDGTTDCGGAGHKKASSSFSCSELFGNNDNRSCQDRIVISLENPIYQVWKILIVFICIVSSYIYAYFAAFGGPPLYSTYYYVKTFSEIILLLDIIV